jgi:heat-inducible transcriptional repressor
MEERKNRVLQAIIDDYIQTAEPVGSRTIARKYRLGVSPATIRNEMSDLEEMGYLEQPHTSAGRIPSDRGYRYYVDSLMETREVTSQEEEMIRRTFQRKLSEIDALIRETSRVLSDSAHLASIVSGPQLAKAVVRDIHMVPIAPDKALMIYVTDSGFVENQVIELPVEVTMVEIQQVSEVLNEHLRGRSLATLTRAAIREMHDALQAYGALVEQTLTFLEEKLEPSERRRVYLGGASHMLEQPEFRSIDRLRPLLNLLEKEDVMTDLLDEEGSGPGVSILIGEEIRYREMHDCSIVSATYRIGDRTVGRIGVLGPKRMDYSRIVSLVDSVSRHLSDRRF